MRNVERRGAWIASSAAALLFLAGVVYSLSLGDALRYLPDEADYYALAENLAQGSGFSLDGVHPSAFRAPGYPLLLAPFAWLGGGVTSFRILNFACLALLAALLYHGLKTHTSSFAGVLGVLGIAAYPVMFYTAGVLYPQTLAALLLMVVLFAFTRPQPEAPHWLLGGLSLGWLVLAVPTNLFVWAWLVLRGLFSSVFRRHPGYWLALGLALALVLAWTGRNALVFGRFVLVSSNSGENLLAGNNPLAGADTGRTVDLSAYEAQAVGLDDIDRDYLYTRSALAYIQSHPVETARLYVAKLINHFNYRNELVTQGERSAARDILMAISYYPLLLLAAARVFVSRRWPLLEPEKLAVGFYLLAALASALFFTRIRFRLPYDPLLVLLASGLLARWFGMKKMESSHPLGEIPA